MSEKQILYAIAEATKETDWYSAKEVASQHIRTARTAEQKRNRRIWYEFKYRNYTNGMLV